MILDKRDNYFCRDCNAFSCQDEFSDKGDEEEDPVENDDGDHPAEGDEEGVKGDDGGDKGDKDEDDDEEKC